MTTTTTTSPFRSRVNTFLDSFRDEKEYDSHLTGFWTNWSRDMPYHKTIPHDDITLLFIGDSKRNGLFQLAGDHSMLGGGLKPWARSALLTLNNIIQHDQDPYLFRSRFRQMPVSDLKKIYLNKHLEHGDAAQQMAAFQLASLLFDAYPRTEFMSILHDKSAAFDIFSRFHAGAGATRTAAPLATHTTGTTATHTAGVATAAKTALPATTAGVNIAKDIPIPIVEQTTQPIVQPVVRQEKETVIQPVVVQPEVVNVTKETIVNPAKVEAPVLRETVAPTKYEAGGFVEKTTQPIVQPVIHREKETVIQPVVVQPEIVNVTRETIVNAPKVEAPVLTEKVAAAKYQVQGVVENVTQPVLQPVVHQEKETVIQPVVVQPQIKEVVRDTIVNAPKVEAPVMTEKVAAPIFVTGHAGERVNLTQAVHGVHTTSATTGIPTGTTHHATTGTTRTGETVGQRIAEGVEYAGEKMGVKKPTGTIEKVERQEGAIGPGGLAGYTAPIGSEVHEAPLGTTKPLPVGATPAKTASDVRVDKIKPGQENLAGLPQSATQGRIGQ